MGGSNNGVEVREGSIRLFFVYQGQRHRKTLSLNGAPLPPTAANVRYAHRVAVEIRERIRNGTFSMVEYFPTGASTGNTVKDHMDRWLGLQRIEVSTRKGYESAIKFWSQTLGTKTLRAVKPSDVLEALATRPTISGKTINNYVAVLRKAFDLALMDRLVDANPVGVVRRAKHQKPPVDPFSIEEVEVILAHMRRAYDPQIVNYTEFKFFTGVRTGESFGATWARVDFNKRHLLVADSIVRGVYKATTKTKDARVIDLNDRAYKALQRQRQHTFLAGGHIFIDPRFGAAWEDERAFRRSFWTPTLKATGIRYRPPYNTRHTYATMMLMAGVTPAYAARQMGHSVEMFLTTYAKWIDGAANATEQAKLEAFVRGTSGGTLAGISGN